MKNKSKKTKRRKIQSKTKANYEFFDRLTDMIRSTNSELVPKRKPRR